MAQETLKRPKKIVERNIQLTNQITHYLLDHPDMIESLPDEFELVVLPDDDPEIRLYNLDLLDRYGSEGKPVVFARIRSHVDAVIPAVKPSLFVPLAA